MGYFTSPFMLDNTSMFHLDWHPRLLLMKCSRCPVTYWWLSMHLLSIRSWQKSKETTDVGFAEVVLLRKFGLGWHSGHLPGNKLHWLIAKCYINMGCNNRVGLCKLRGVKVVCWGFLGFVQVQMEEDGRMLGVACMSSMGKVRFMVVLKRHLVVPYQVKWFAFLIENYSKPLYTCFNIPYSSFMYVHMEVEIKGRKSASRMNIGDFWFHGWLLIN